MPLPTLIVGLGGTGTLVATFIKKNLMETSGGIWPLKEVKILAFDTDIEQPEINGLVGQIREAGQVTGATRLANGEFFFTGGNVQALMREVAKGKHAHLRSWLLADWYLNTISDKVFNLNEGAGQFRQFGRLAVFRDVATPSNSIIYNTLNDALFKLSRDNPSMNNLQVFVISSLAGGTGAGMFVDVTYLIRKISEQSNVNLKNKMSVQGYLVLPNAFNRTVDQSSLKSMNVRAFAAMRENARLTVGSDYAHGYPMYYQESGSNPILRSTLRGKLFDSLYYLDGQGDRSHLGVAGIRNGVSPAIADVISAATDTESGPKFSNYVANIEAERVNRIISGEISQKTATLGTVGTYTIVFPIYQIIETWAHNLGIHILNRLVTPDMTRLDPRTGIPSTLLSNANQENPYEDGRTAAFKFLLTNKPIIYQVRDENGNMNTIQAEPTLFFGELARIAEVTASPGSAFFQELSGRTTNHWKSKFYPRGEDRETQQLIQRLENIINMRLYDKDGKTGSIQASDQMKPKEDPSLGAERVLIEVHNYKARYLGDEDARTGQRFGGVYHTTLSQIAEYHLVHFNFYLNTYIQYTLNGSPNHPGIEARGGKIGYLAEFLEALFQLLIRTQETLQRVQQDKRQKGDSRRNAIKYVQSALQRMKTLSTKKGLIGRPTGEAFQSQQSYLLAESQLIDILQTEAMEDVILETIMRMIDYVASARDAIQTWVETLATGQDGLYANLLRGRKQAESDRAAEKDIRSHFVLSDEKYEKERYEAYLSTKEGGWVEYLLRSLTWEIRTKMQGGRPKLEFVLKVLDMDDKNRSLAEQAANNNLSLWLSMCRQPFETAHRHESVIGYLLSHPIYKDPMKIVEMIYEHGGVSLNFNGGNPLAANFIRVYFQTEEEAGHRAYLRFVIQQLAQRSGQRVLDSEQEYRFVQFTNSEDRFKFTIIFTQELLELERISAYDEGKKAYLGNSDQMAKGDRRILHIFPAEVHAAEYESRLPAELKQTMRLFSDDVTLQMEDVARLKLFLICYVYGLIKREAVRDEKNSENKSVWKLLLPPQHEIDQFGNPTKPDEIWLTNPAHKAVLLDAIMTFNFIGRDVGHGHDYVHEIDYGAVDRALLLERSKDASRRLLDKSFGTYNQDLLASVRAFKDERQMEVSLNELARIEHISEYRDRFEKEVLPHYQKNLGTSESQKDYDIASVFLLMLNDEVKTVRQILNDRIRTLRDLGEVLEDNPSNNQSTDTPSNFDIGPLHDFVPHIENHIYLQPLFTVSLSTNIIEAGQVVRLKINSTANLLKGSFRFGDTTFLINSPGFYLEDGQNKIVVPITSNGVSVDVDLRSHVPGHHQIKIEPFVESAPQMPIILDIIVSGKHEKEIKKLPNPLKPRTAPQPDICIRTYTTPVGDNGGKIKIEYILYSPVYSLHFPGSTPAGSVTIKISDLKRILAHLEKTISIENISGKDQNLSSIGRDLYDLLLPNVLKKYYVDISKSKVRNILILSDPSLWIPWEILKPYGDNWEHEHLGQRYNLGRWIEGWGALRNDEFPIGQVCLVGVSEYSKHYSLTEWQDLLSEGDISRLDKNLFVEWPDGIPAAMEYQTPIWGLHFEDIPDALVEKSGEMVLIGDIPLSPENVRTYAINLHTKRPLVTFGMRSQKNNSAFTRMEEKWLPVFIQSGASAFVGTLWAVQSEVDQLFWRVFYQSVWNGSALGEAVNIARQNVSDAYPESIDGLSYYLIGDPMSVGYVPPLGEAFVTLECLDHDINQPLMAGKKYAFQAAIRNSPPIWYKDRLHQSTNSKWSDSKLQVIANGFSVAPSELLAFTELSSGHQVCKFEITPKEQKGKGSGGAEEEIFFNYLSGTDSEILKSIAIPMTIKPLEVGNG